MSTTKHETDVLIVGAGPTGLTLACELLRRGVRCRIIIDTAPAPAATSRALGLQPRTLELFDTIGIVDQVLSTGGPVIDANLYDGYRLLLTLSTAGVQELDTPYPRLWITPQTSVDWPLEARLRELGGAVERSCELVDFCQADSKVIATVERGDDGGASKTEEIRASWLAGCDGAHSRVRKTLGVTRRLHGTRWFWAWILGLPLAGVATHLLYRHKTRGWRGPWGGWRGVEATKRQQVGEFPRRRYSKLSNVS